MNPIREQLERKTYMPIVAGKGVNKTGHVQDFYPGEDRRVERFERSLGEFDTREESFLVLWAHFKRVSAGLKAWRSRRGKSL